MTFVFDSFIILQIRLWESDLNRVEMSPAQFYDEFPSRVCETSKAPEGFANLYSFPYEPNPLILVHFL